MSILELFLRLLLLSYLCLRQGAPSGVGFCFFFCVCFGVLVLVLGFGVLVFFFLRFFLVFRMVSGCVRHVSCPSWSVWQCFCSSWCSFFLKIDGAPPPRELRSGFWRFVKHHRWWKETPGWHEEFYGVNMPGVVYFASFVMIETCTIKKKQTRKNNQKPLTNM